MRSLAQTSPKTLMLVAIALIVGAIGATYLTGALFADAGPAETIEACANGQHLRIVDDSAKDCKRNETGVSWNQLDSNLSPGDVVAAMESGPIDLDGGTTIGGLVISTGSHLSEGEVEAFVTNGIGTISGDVSVIGSITAG